ncbi:uncharacterized protein DSM5745_00154 [Aspergillus mulundensis]|uniref:Potassium transport protein n=1 Tax=Aspergillus mulundensis TaxID=1810919 RepID=A0A3D8T2P8_9EURO|nr:hypothetical protein DSM5745_00154 [Aspergillus mulundensis]RDW92832.1 hypothetical protein DSM5745_00154 [Aspergillus mulundensis]
MALITSVIIYPGNNLAYIDALFFSSGAATQSGLNTVDFNLLQTYQQVILYWVSMITTPIFINTVLVFVRLYWFEKRFQRVVRDARALRSTRSRNRTISESKYSLSSGREEAGIGGRPIMVLRNDFANPPQGDAPQSAPVSPDETDAESGSPTSTASSVIPGQSQSQPATINRDFGDIRVPAQLSPEHHIALLEKQRKTKGALRIPSPREYDRGGAPEVLEEEENEANNNLTKTKSGQSEPRSPRDVDANNTANMDGPHITFTEPQLPPSRTRNETKEADAMTQATRRSTFTGIRRTLTEDPDRTTLPYLSYQATVARNSNFIALTEEQRDELGGIEYRALKTLAFVLVSYYVCFHLFGIFGLMPWIMETSGGEVVKQAGQGRPWWAIFSAGSAFNDVGFTLTPDSMVSFQTATWPLLLMTYLIIIGNTGFPCMLRFIIWVTSKVCSKETPLWEELKFLLDHPRRCFTLLFPRNATWWLVAILVLLNGVDVILFLILDLHDGTVTSLSPGNRFVAGLFQASNTRTAGFSVVSLADVHPAVQISYMIMMYISVFPIAISLRRTNVYEEKSLGIFPDEECIDDENQTPPSYISTHLRRQLGHDLWFVCAGLFVITIIEGARLQDRNDYSFQIWSILFEVVSAYGTVGLSLGYPGVNASFTSQLHTGSVLIIIFMQIRGRHRGLPHGLDRAIMLPSESLHQKEVEDAEWRMRRRASNLSQMGSLGMHQSQAGSETHSIGVSSALDTAGRNRELSYNTEMNTGNNVEMMPIRRPPTGQPPSGQTHLQLLTPPPSSSSRTSSSKMTFSKGTETGNDTTSTSPPHHIVCLEECHCAVPTFSFPHTYTGYASTSLSTPEITSRLHDATIAITTLVPITPEILAACPKLQCVVVMATGVEWVDIPAFQERRVKVVNCPGANVSTVAEHALALYFAARRKIVELHNITVSSDEYAERRTLVQRFPNGPPHTTLQEVVAVVGYGALGKRIESVLRALGMQVLIAERKGAMGTDVREGRVPFEVAIAHATVVMVTVAKSAETIGLIGGEELESMRKDALVINVARGGIVDEAALVKALREGWIAGAATDVFDGEPPVRGQSVLLEEGVPSLTLSPHVAWFSETTIRNLQDLLVEGVEGFVEGNLVNVVC